MRYLLADCRWALDDPGPGRRAYLAGHIPGAVFLDVERDLAAPPGAGGRHPLPERAALPRRRALPGSARRASWSRTGRSGARSGSGGSCVTSATTPAP